MNTNLLIIALVLLLRFTLPFLLIPFPFQVSWLNFVLDTVDGDILVPLGLEVYHYQIIDKLADLLTYVLMFYVGRRWKIGRTITILFFLRLIGQLAFFVIGNDKVLFFFPNFLEPLFMIYSFLLYKYGKTAFVKYKKYIIAIWFVIICYKIWNEWNIHIAQFDLSENLLGL